MAHRKNPDKKMIYGEVPHDLICCQSGSNLVYRKNPDDGLYLVVLLIVGTFWDGPKEAHYHNKLSAGFDI